MIPPHIIPTMDWNNIDKTSAFVKFCRKCDYMFQSYFKGISAEERVRYIILWLGDEGDHIFRTLTWADEEKDTKGSKENIRQISRTFWTSYNTQTV